MGIEPRRLGHELLRAGLGHAERLRHRRGALPAEPRREPDRHGRRARLPNRRRDRGALLATRRTSSSTEMRLPAHMAIHLVLLEAVPVALLLAAGRDRIATVRIRPVAAGIASTAIVVAWHVPVALRRRTRAPSAPPGRARIVHHRRPPPLGARALAGDQRGRRTRLPLRDAQRRRQCSATCSSGHHAPSTATRDHCTTSDSPARSCSARGCSPGSPPQPGYSDGCCARSVA